MASLGEVTSQSSKPLCMNPARRDINTTSEMWHGSSYCTPQSAPLIRCAVNRRLHCSTVPPAAFQLFHTSAAAISTEPTSIPNKSGSEELNATTLTSCKVSEGQKDVTTSFPFNDEQIDCICDVLMRSKNVERLQCFVNGLTQRHLLRNSDPLYKVCT